MSPSAASELMSRGSRFTPTKAGWDARLYDGLRVARISSDTRATLGAALGQVGVEAEYLLLLVSSFPGNEKPSRQVGVLFLQRLTGALDRLVEASINLEVATQGFLSALTSAYPRLIESLRGSGPWWPAFDGYVAPGLPIEARLRRCGFAYRHVLESQLPLHLDAILEQMALTIYALSVLPPAGVTPLAALALGLDELAAAIQGEIVPRHIRGLTGDPKYPGALGAMARLFTLDAQGDTSLESDIAWARAAYVAARDDEQRLAKQPGQESLRALAAHDAYEWAATVSLLEGMRRHSRG
jgi:hypothetical protein